MPALPESSTLVMSLEGRSILLTRAHPQNQTFRKRLEEEGAQVVEVPTIEIEEPESWDPVDRVVARLGDYDWVVFTSANAVEAFCRRVTGPLPRVAVVGSQTARRAEGMGIDVGLVPAEFRWEGVLEALPGDMSGQRILIPRGDLATDEFPKALRLRGATVDVVTTYRTVRPRRGREDLEKTLEAGIDCITFTSGSTARNLLAMLDDPEAPVRLAGIAIAVIGPTTRRVVEGLGLTVTIEPPEATIPAMSEAIRTYFEEQQE